MRAITTLQTSPNNTPAPTVRSPQEVRKGCWRACGKKTVYTLSGAGCGLVTIAAISLLIGVTVVCTTTYMLRAEGSGSRNNAGVKTVLGIMLPLGLVCLTLLGIPIGGVVGYRYANRV